MNIIDNSMFNSKSTKMKKSFLLKIVAGAGLFIFLGFNASAQPMDANLTVDQTVDQYVTVSKAMPYHVTPDIYFNPGYIAPGWAVASSFLWSFAVNPAIFNFSSTTAINPDITIGTVGNYILNVVETSADGCPDASPTTINIHVLAAPSFDFGGDLVRPDVEQCGGLAATNVLFDITVNNADDYLVDWTYDVDNLQSDKATLDDELAASDVTNTDDAFAAAGAGLVLTNQTFPVLNNKVTRYTFTLDGINDAVSRVSDYILPLLRNIAATNFTNYAPGADNTFVVMVLPAPTTGPIYHVPNL
jgi:hypothetical protein